MRKHNKNLHDRKSVRLKNYDYSQAGAYFITICTQDKEHLFGEIINRKMHLNAFGQIVHEEWEKLPEWWPHIYLSVFTIMPNHMHGILVLQYKEGSFLKNDFKKQWKEKPTIGQIVGAYCSISSNECLKYSKENSPDEILGKVWQRGFHDHIIRHERAFNFIADYIVNNPANWEKDKFYS